MEFGASSEDIALTMFSHPTVSEAFHEATLAADNQAIHIEQKKMNLHEYQGKLYLQNTIYLYEKW